MYLFNIIHLMISICFILYIFNFIFCFYLFIYCLFLMNLIENFLSEIIFVRLDIKIDTQKFWFLDLFIISNLNLYYKIYKLKQYRLIDH